MQRSNPVSTTNPAEIYEERFVPALFLHWGPVVTAAAEVSPGDRVLDVACGTGALTRAVAKAAGAEGRVTGLDPNPDMLDVARRLPGRIEWVEGSAEALPFDDARFDAVVSQFGMMFFDDKPKALAEMMRVLKPGGRMAVAVCDAVERSDGYGTFARLLERLFGPEVADAFRSPFVLGDPQLLRKHCEEAGIPDARIERHEGEVQFDSVEAMVSTERACVWTLGGVLDDAQFATLATEAETALAKFRRPDGRLAFSMPAIVVTATKS